MRRAEDRNPVAPYRDRPYHSSLRLTQFRRLKQWVAILPEISMKNPKIHPVLLALLIYVFVLAACSKQSPDRPNANPSGDKHAASSSASQPGAAAEQQGSATQPSATPAAVAGNKGAPATEKHRLNLTNYSGVPITISLNGEWLGQWDNSVDYPQLPALQGKNQLTVEIPSEPKGTVTVNVYASRNGQEISILSLNFQGKSGTQTFTFVAK